MKKVFLLIFLVLCIGLTSCTKVVNIYEDNTENINNPLLHRYIINQKFTKLFQCLIIGICHLIKPLYRIQSAV